MAWKKEDPYKGYYTLPFTWEPFEGEVIELDKEAMNVLFQHYSDGNEYKFRQTLERYDEWFFDKPYKVASKWLTYITKWLQTEKEKKAFEEFGE